MTDSQVTKEATAPKKSVTMTRFSAHEKEQMKSGNRTAYVALPKNVKAKRATKNDALNKHSVPTERGSPSRVGPSPTTLGALRGSSRRRRKPSRMKYSPTRSNLVPGKRFLIEEQMFGNTIGPRKRIVFEKPPGFTKMDVLFREFYHQVLARGLVGPVPLLPVPAHSGLPPVPRRGCD